MLLGTALKDETIVGLITHEIIHILGFSVSLFDRLGNTVIITILLNTFVCMYLCASDLLMKMATLIMQLWIFWGHMAKLPFLGAQRSSFVYIIIHIQYAPRL